MKILYITTKAEYGGVQTHILQCASFMKKEGWDVAVMAFPGGVLENSLREAGIPFYPNPYLKNSYNPFLGLKAIQLIQSVTREFGPDVVSLHSSAAGFWGRLALRNTVPTIFTAHGWAFAPGAPLARRAVAMFAEKIVTMFAQKIICVSECDQELALKYGIVPEKKLTVIHNGVESLATEQNLSKPKQDTVPVVFVGRLSGQKNPELLLQSFSSLEPSVQSKAHLYLIGDGEKRPHLVSYCDAHGMADKVTFLGEMPRSSVIKTLVAFTENFHHPVFALISHYEGLPRSILEAMSLGYAVIASDVGGVREELKDGAGIVLPPYNQEYLVETLTNLITQAETRAALASQAQLRATQEFSLTTMLEKTKAVYLSLRK